MAFYWAFAEQQSENASGYVAFWLFIDACVVKMLCTGFELVAGGIP